MLKIATLAPEGTMWVREMREGARLIEERTEGRVAVKFYTGGVMGNDRKVLRKMRVGQLQGAVFTPSSLGERYPDLNIYGLPLVFRSLDEVDYVRERLDERLIEGLEQAGLVSFGFAEGGFAKLMSRTPVRNLDDLRGRKVWVPEGDRPSYVAMEALGLSPVVLPLTDVLTGLQTGLIDIIASSAVAAVALQWHTRVKYVTDLPLAYILATMVIERAAFEQLTEHDRAVVREVMSEIYRRIDRQNRADEREAEAALLASGITRVEPELSQIREWRRIVAEANRREGERGAFDVQLLNEMERYLQESRGSTARASGS